MELPVQQCLNGSVDIMTRRKEKEWPCQKDDLQASIKMWYQFFNLVFACQ